MLVIVLMTSLITFISLILGALAYLISIISDETDDFNSSDSLGLETDHLSNYPTISPLASRQMSSSDGSKNHEICEHNLADGVENGPKRSIPNEATLAEPMTPNSRLKVSSSRLKTDKISAKLTTELSGQTSGGPKITNSEDPAYSSQWDVSVSEQKNLIISRLGGPASKLIFDDFDSKEMELGGTCLHWCKSRKSIDKLIRLGVPIEIKNCLDESPVHIAVRRRRLQVLIGLLCHGAKVDSYNHMGETPLSLACQVGDVFACKLLLVFDSDFEIQDKDGKTPRHHIATIIERYKQKQVGLGPHLILAMLNEVGASRCNRAKKRYSCTDGCSADGTYNGKSYNRWPDFKKESLYKKHMFTDIIEAHKRSKMEELLNHREDQDSIKRSRLLCIDGGGMRGIIVCQIMIEIEKYLKRPLLSYFDWIGGTSAGAFVACALCVGTPLDQLRRICFDVKDEVFSGSRPYNSKFLERVLKRTLGATYRLSDIKDRRLAVTTVLADRDPCQLRFFRNYPSVDDLLESYGYKSDEFNNMSGHSIIAKVHSLKVKSDDSLGLLESLSSESTIDSAKLENQLKASDHDAMTVNAPRVEDLLSDDPKSFGSADQKSPMKVNLNSDPIDEFCRDPFVWQAVRASAAAPFFFKPYGPFLDGGIISNNPTLDMMSEQQAYNAVRRFLKIRLEGSESINKVPSACLDKPIKELDLVVSLGTGRGRVVGPHEIFDFSQVVASFATVFSPVELIRSIKAARNLFRKLMQRSCQTEDHILDRAQSWCSSLKIPYFRINPPLATNISIDDKRDEQLINAIWQAKLYMIAMKDQLIELKEILDGPQEDC